MFSSLFRLWPALSLPILSILHRPTVHHSLTVPCLSFSFYLTIFPSPHFLRLRRPRLWLLGKKNVADRHDQMPRSSLEFPANSPSFSFSQLERLLPPSSFFSRTFSLTSNSRAQQDRDRHHPLFSRLVPLKWNFSSTLVSSVKGDVFLGLSRMAVSGRNRCRFPCFFFLSFFHSQTLF